MSTLTESGLGEDQTPAGVSEWTGSGPLVSLILHVTSAVELPRSATSAAVLGQTGPRPQMLLTLLTYCYATGSGAIRRPAATASPCRPSPRRELTMKEFPLLAALVLIVMVSGCASSKRHGVSRHDLYDAVKIDQMAGNAVSGQVFERTIVCLNARRETRPPTPVTNLTVTFLTNVSVSYLTNLVVTAVTNQSRTMSTNAVALPSTPAAATHENAGSESSQTVVLNANQPPSSTNQTVTVANNLSLSKAPNQTVSTASRQTLLSLQTTVATNHLSITTADNQVSSVETNQTVTMVTNQTVTAVTNVVVTLPSQPPRDYYLVVEFTPPPDFTLQSGESLVLLLDGARHGLAQTNSQTAFVARRGFTSTLYKVPPELLVDLANAQEVKVRLKGANHVIEKSMSRRSRESFREFLLRFFTPESPSAQRDVPTITAASARPGV